jgi:phage shock protein PspC (stress-responsive transcriptional regulator)
MKKTVSINIKGINFLIEEDAYELLSSYLKRLENNLKDQHGSKEIVEDIELRIAELCQNILKDKKEVVEIEDIKQILSTLGNPEDYIEEEFGAEQNYRKDSDSEFVRERRLYRDMENAKIAGISSGLSNYFNVDVIIIRIIFLLFVFIGGFGVPLYIILWIVIPKANSTIDRLRMQGKPITVDSVKEEFEQATERVTSSSKDFVSKLKNEKQFVKRFSNIGYMIKKISGIFLVGFGALLLISFMTFVLIGLNFIPIETIDGYISLNKLGELILNDENDAFWAWLGVVLTAFATILFLISNGTYLLLNIKNRWSKYASFILFILGILGVLSCLYVGSIITRELIVEAKIEKEISINSIDNLYINTDNAFGNENIKIREINKNNSIMILDTLIKNFGIDLEFRKSKDSTFRLVQVFSSHSSNHEKAIKKVKNISHTYTLDSNKVKLNSYFTYPLNDKLRNQKVKIIIEIPQNKKLYLNGQEMNLIDDENIRFTKYGVINKSGEFKVWN